MSPRGIFNWTFNDVVRFLKDNDFSLNHIEGSHYFYTGYQFKQRTLKGIILQSGIPKEKWLQ